MMESERVKNGLSKALPDAPLCFSTMSFCELPTKSNESITSTKYE
jgi:hypothetical protein